MKPRIVIAEKWLEDCLNYYVKIIHAPLGKEFSEATMLNNWEAARVCDLSQILNKMVSENIWRSWQIFSDKLCLDMVGYVPLFIDIDNEDQNIDDAYELTRLSLQYIEQLPSFNNSDSLRVVFSGKKGFHIEAKPLEPIDNQQFRNLIVCGLNKMGQKNKGCLNSFEIGVIDTNKEDEYIRLTDSYNSWFENNSLKQRKVIQLTLDEFRRSNAKKIISKSEIA